VLSDLDAHGLAAYSIEGRAETIVETRTNDGGLYPAAAGAARVTHCMMKICVPFSIT